MIVGYVRVSTIQQNEDRQVDALNKFGVEKIFIDKMSGKDTIRPELQKMMDFVREGDTVVVHDFSRFSRSTKDLLNLVDQLKEKNVQFISLKENIDTTTSSGQFVLTVFAALNELERNNILERQQEGIAIAKKKGVKFGRKPANINESRFIELYTSWKKGNIKQRMIMEEFGISRSTYNRIVSKFINKGLI